MRYRELDLARGFTVLIMPAVHFTMLYGNSFVYESWWGSILNWVATMPGAQLFMMLMGISFSITSIKKSHRAIIIKLGRWLTLSYALNLLKFTILALMGFLPIAFYSSVGIAPGLTGTLRLFLVGDILQLAALSLLFVYLFDRFEISNKALVLCSAILIIVSPYIWNLSIRNTVINQIISLVTGNDPLVYFPVFPWLLFPLIGYLIGKLLRKGILNYSWLALAGAMLMLPEIWQHGFHFTLAENLYRPSPIQALYHVGFCFVWLWVCALLANYVKRDTHLWLLNFSSKHITLIYCLQWALIFWCIIFTPYRGLGLYPTMAMSVVISLVVYLLAYAILNINSQLLNRQKNGRVFRL